jgi:hypothetical protein
MSQIGECIVCKNTFTPSYEREMGMMLCQDCYAARTKAVKPGTNWGQRKLPNDPMVQGTNTRNYSGCLFFLGLILVSITIGAFANDILRYGNRIVCGG